MAVHTGDAVKRDADATASLLRVPGATPWSLRPLGAHRLTGFSDSSQPWQLDDPERPSELSPLGAGDDVANNLPATLSSFVGRTHELVALLDHHRLVTITGSGGCGKAEASRGLHAV